MDRRLGINNVQISSSGPDVLVIRSSTLDDTARGQILSVLSKQFNTIVTANRFDNVGPSVSKEVADRALLAMGASSLALFGGVTLREFSNILLVGMFSGSYSSDFIATPILEIWEKQEWRNWFRPKAQAAA